MEPAAADNILVERSGLSAALAVVPHMGSLHTRKMVLAVADITSVTAVVLIVPDTIRWAAVDVDETCGCVVV